MTPMSQQGIESVVNDAGRRQLILLETRPSRQYAGFDDMEQGGIFGYMDKGRESPAKKGGNYETPAAYIVIKQKGGYLIIPLAEVNARSDSSGETAQQYNSKEAPGVRDDYVPEGQLRKEVRRGEAQGRINRLTTNSYESGGYIGGGYDTGYGGYRADGLNNESRRKDPIRDKLSKPERIELQLEKLQKGINVAKSDTLHKSDEDNNLEDGDNIERERRNRLRNMVETNMMQLDPGYLPGHIDRYIASEKPAEMDAVLNAMAMHPPTAQIGRGLQSGYGSMENTGPYNMYSKAAAMPGMASLKCC